MSLFALSSLGFIAAVIATLVDGRHAVAIATAALALGLAPTAASVAGDLGGLALLTAALGAVVAERLARAVASRLTWVAGLDPDVPVYAPPQELFGPRSTRLAGAVFVIPMASWVSFNVPVGGGGTVIGLLFPCIYAALCGAIRLLVARTLEDTAVGVAGLGMGSATAWILVAGPAQLDVAAAGLALPVIAALSMGWLGARHRRRGVTA